jgi:DnaK suppressor protein
MAPTKSAKKAKPKSKAKAKSKPHAKPQAKLVVKALPKPKAMPKKELQYFEKRLLEERRRVLKELGHHDEIFNTSQQASDGDLSAYSFHMADQGTDAMEREKAFLFASQEGRFLWHIDQALRRLYKSPATFGKCHNCGNDIAHERLDALPHARYCIECKQREEDAKK